jgi:predicted CopG family antitoxin
MNMIRTTISLREDVYENIRRVALAKRMSMSEVVNVKLSGGGLSPEETEKKVEADMKVFKRLASVGVKTDEVVAAVRKFRDRDRGL